MGLLDKRRPILPAPTDTTIESADETYLEPDVATDLSRVTDRSHQTIPDDGSPITITTAPKKTGIGKLTKPGNLSQTSLLIEYFEHGPDSGRKPSIRVKFNPSSSKKGIIKDDGHILVTEAQGTRRPSQSHRIALDTDVSEQVLDSNISSLDSEVPFRRRRGPIEVEVNQGSDLSKLSNSPEARYIIPESDISSMPGDSMLGVSRPAIITHPPKSYSSLGREEMSEKENLMPPVIPTNRNASSERIAQKVIEKISNKPRASTKSALSDKSRSRSSASRDVDFAAEPRRRSAKNIEDGSVTGTASSLVSGSLLSADPRSNDARSVRSGNSNVSINNPKLLQTVEDAIRRLILPELKEIKKDQRHASQSKRTKDVDPSDISESSVSREETTRRRSSGKTKRRSSREHGHRVSSGSRRHERHHKADDYDSPSEQSYQHSESLDSVSAEDDLKARKHRKSHRNRDLAAAGLAGAALTAAALKHHDSGSSLDHSERRKKRSKSRSSRSASVVEAEHVFHKHGIPPMPMRSEVDTELTRSSLLSSNTAGTATPTSREVREVVRGSPQGLLSPASHTPSRTPVERQLPEKSLADIKRGLGTHHGNFSEHDLATHRDEFDEDVDDEHHENYQAGSSPLGHGLLTDPERARAYERNLHTQHPIRRGLSPIQSVASYATTEPNRNSLVQPRSIESFASRNKDRDISDDISIASMSSAASTDLAKSRRPQGLSFENRSEIMQPHKGQVDGAARNLEADEASDEQNDHFRDSYASSDPKVHSQRMSNYTDDSMDAPYLDKVTAGQHLAYGYGANPEYVHTPPGVESAVASLYEPSVLDVRSTQSPRMSQSGSSGPRDLESPNKLDREAGMIKTGSPLKHRYSFDGDEQAKETMHRHTDSPPQSPARSFEDIEPPAPVLSDSAEKLSRGLAGDESAQASPESEITTNPSVIQGPMAPIYATGNRDHWPYGPTPPPAQTDIFPTALPAASRDISSAHTNLVPEALSIKNAPSTDTKIQAAAVDLTTPGANDEGYETGVTGANGPSPVMRERAAPPPVAFSPGLQLDNGLDEEDDPFTTGKRNQYVSGLSQGMSPLYDSATGRGVDRIQSKDVVALMDHLTVRDAQRSARDTEILMTLVTTAAEMRNSFQDMKKFITDQGDEIMDTADQQHEKTQKVIGGPRPQPAPPSARFVRTPQSEEDDLPAKRRNVFRRALRGLGTKNTSELQNIEGMLMQLLDDVDSLKGLHVATQGINEPGSTSFNSTDNARPPTDPGYEPEGQAGTSSTGDRSGIFSNNSSRQANYRGLSVPQGTGNRVSTVIERDEEYDDEDDVGADDDLQTTPRASYREQDPRNVRGSSVPLHTPPRMHDANQGTLSNENTPQYSNEGSSGKKHKSFASSFFPKMVSRWSKTTASSGGDYRASTQTKPRPYSEVSQSGSNIPDYDYDPRGDDRLRSNISFQHEQYDNDENRPPSPLIPSQLSENPKYQAHRNSVNLQHPQPRQGPTGRFQNKLENEAQYYNNDPISPSSVTSSQWENQAALSGMPGAMPNGDYRHGGQLSPISDGGYSETSEAMMDRERKRGVRSSGSASSLSKQGPPRPPKIADEDPLVPQRPPKTLMSPSGSRQATYVDHVAAARAGSPAYDKSPVSAMRSSPAQGRKPSGPRPLSSSGQYSKGQKGDLNMVKKTRFRGSPYQIDSGENLVS